MRRHNRTRVNEIGKLEIVTSLAERQEEIDEEEQLNFFNIDYGLIVWKEPENYYDENGKPDSQKIFRDVGECILHPDPVISGIAWQMANRMGD